MGLALGLDVGGTKILGVAITEDGTVVEEVRLSSPNSPTSLLAALENATAQLADTVARRSTHVTAIGIGVPGLVDSNGVLNETVNLPGVEGIAIRDELDRRFARLFPDWSQKNFAIDNDGTCTAAGEWRFGAARDLSDAVVVALGTGIGGGLIAGGHIVHGGRGFAGEIGHFVVEADGPLCVCGRRGCWEQFASGNGHARIARQEAERGHGTAILKLAGGHVEAIESKHVFVAARAGDLEAWGIVDTIARYLALGLANLVEIFDPLAVVVGGGVINDADIFMPMTREYFAQTRRGTGNRAVDIRIAELGEQAGAVGAAVLALDGSD